MKLNWISCKPFSFGKSRAGRAAGKRNVLAFRVRIKFPNGMHGESPRIVFITVVVSPPAAKTASWCGAPPPACSHMTGSLTQPKSRWRRTCCWPSSGAAAWWRESVWWSGWASSATTWAATGQLRWCMLQRPFAISGRLKPSHWHIIEYTNLYDAKRVKLCASARSYYTFLKNVFYIANWCYNMANNMKSFEN